MNLVLTLPGNSSQKAKPVFIIELNRHGARAPVSKLADVVKLPWIDKYGKGELTPVGQRQRYFLGKHMFYKYPEIFKNGLKPREYHVRSTSYNRTIMSAFSEVMGIMNGSTYGITKEPLVFENGDERLNPPQELLFNASDLGFRTGLKKGVVPICVNSELKIEDLVIFANNVPCPSNVKALNKFNNEYSRKLEGNKNIKEIVEKAIKIYGIEEEAKDWDRNVELCYEFGDLVIQNYLNSPNPRIKKGTDLYHRLSHCYYLGNVIQNMPEKVYKASQTEILNNIVAYFERKVRGFDGQKYDFEQKYVQYSAHDMTIDGHLSYLGILNYTCLFDQVNQGKDLGCEVVPPVASALVWELLEISSNSTESNKTAKIPSKKIRQKESRNYGVRVVYNGEYVNYCKQEKPKESNFICPLEDFIKIVKKDMTIDDLRGYCGLKAGINFEFYKDILALTVIILLFLNLVLVGIVLIFKSKVKKIINGRATATDSYKKTADGKEESNGVWATLGADET